MRDDILQRLKELRVELEIAQRNAAAEAAYTATGGASNPWSGASEKLDELSREQRSLELLQSGEELEGKLERLRQLDAEFDDGTTGAPSCG